MWSPDTEAGKKDAECSNRTSNVSFEAVGKKLYKGTARVRFEQSKKEILSEKPSAFLHLKNVFVY